MKTDPRFGRLLLIVLLASCPLAPARADGTGAAAAQPAAGAPVPLFDGLGKHHRKITTTNPLAKRYSNPQPDDRHPLNASYAAAMREVWKQYPDDPDIGALFAEALMDLRPWDLWKPDGTPQPETPEIVSTLETVMRRAPEHPLALHLYVHAVEGSPAPEKGVQAADRLRTLTPGLGHLVHMPSHIDVRLGRWQQAIEANERAIETLPEPCRSA